MSRSQKHHGWKSKGQSVSALPDQVKDRIGVPAGGFLFNRSSKYAVFRRTPRYTEIAPAKIGNSSCVHDVDLAPGMPNLEVRIRTIR